MFTKVFVGRIAVGFIQNDGVVIQSMDTSIYYNPDTPVTLHFVFFFEYG